MSKPTFAEGQEISFGINDGSFQESGFLHGATVTIVEARYGRLSIPAQYQDPKNPIPDRIAAKLTFSLKKLDGTTKVFDKPQEYSTGIPWEGEDSTATVSADGKKLIAKKGFKGFSKQTDIYHLLETAVNAGFPEDTFRGDLSVFDGLTFQIVSEANPRARKNKEGKEPNPKPFFGLLLSPPQSGSTQVSVATSMSGTKEVVTTSIDPNIIAAGIVALTTMVNDATTKSVTRRDVASKVPPIADNNKWDVGTRTGVMHALFDLPKLQVIAAAAGLKLNGETVSA